MICCGTRHTLSHSLIICLWKKSKTRVIVTAQVYKWELDFVAQRLKKWIPKLAGQRILVIGDVILDEYVFGKTTRLSREAPVPVLEFASRQFIPGGAANPAANIVALGSIAIQIGTIGADSAAQNLQDILREQGIDPSSLIADSARPTTVKTRIMAHMGLRFPQQVARMDTLSREPISSAIEQQICVAVEQHIRTVNAVLLSDYHAGLLTPSLIATIRDAANRANVLLTADSQGEFDQYAGLGLVKCNADDARDYLRRPLRTDSDFAGAALELRRLLRLTEAMVITRGAEGATAAISDTEAVHCPAPQVTDVYDTVGAGDTAIAVLTLGAAAGASVVEAVTLANYASGLVVRRVGNYAPKPDELEWALDTWKSP
jgi:rfaE bifunctional protein kinase chain/domain